MTTPSSGVQLPQGPPPPANRALWWVLGTVLVLVVVFIGGGLYVASRIVRNVTVGPNGNVDVSTPAGEIRAKKTTADATGLPVYPGATLQANDAQVQVESPQAEGGGIGVAVANYLTSASLTEVAQWYRKALDPSFQERRGHDPISIDFQGVQLGRPSIAFVSKEAPDRVRAIALKPEGDQTKISLVRVGEREPQ